MRAGSPRARSSGRPWPGRRRRSPSRRSARRGGSRGRAPGFLTKWPSSSAKGRAAGPRPPSPRASGDPRLLVRRRPPRAAAPGRNRAARAPSRDSRIARRAPRWLRAEVRVGGGHALEALAREPQQLDHGDRLHGGRPLLAAEERRPRRRSRPCAGSSGSAGGPSASRKACRRPSFTMYIASAGPPWVTTRVPAGTSTCSSSATSRLQRPRPEPRERGIDAEEVRDVAMLRLEAEERPDLRVAAQQGLEDRAVHLERARRRCSRARSRCAWPRRAGPSLRSCRPRAGW